MEINLNSILFGIEHFANLEPLQNIENTTIQIEGKMYDLSHLLTEINKGQGFQLNDYKNLQKIKIALNRLKTREQIEGHSKEIQERVTDATLPVIQGTSYSSFSPDLKIGLEKSNEIINYISLHIIENILGQMAAVKKDKFSALEGYFPLHIILQHIQPCLLTLEELSNIFRSRETWEDRKHQLLEVLQNKLQPKALEAVLRSLDSWHSILEKLQTEERNLIQKKFDVLCKEAEQNPDFAYIINEINQLSQNVEDLLKQKGRDSETFLPWRNSLISHFNNLVNVKTDGSLYFHEGICFGASLEHALQYMNFKEQHNAGPAPTINLNPTGRFLQALYLLEGSSNFAEKQQAALIEWNQVSNTINQKKQEIVSKNITDVNSSTHKALEALQKRKEACMQALSQASDCSETQSIDFPFPTQFAKHQKFVLKSLMANSDGIPVAEFINSTMEQIFQEHQGEEVHLIVSLSHPLNEEVAFLQAPAQENQPISVTEQEFQPLEESVLEKKISEILEEKQGEGENAVPVPAPLVIRERIKATLLKEHMEKQQQASNHYTSSYRHAIHILLSKDHFELADANLPGVQIFTSSDINSFRLLFLQWLSFNLYQKITNIRQVTRP